MGWIGFLSYPYSFLVHFRLDSTFCSSGKTVVRCSYVKNRRVFLFQNGSLPFNKFDFVVAWLFRECSGPYLFLHAILDPSIKWRSRVFKLAWGGVAQEVKPRMKSTGSRIL